MLAAATSAQDRYTARDVDLAIEIDSHRQVRGDPDRLGQVLTNLLDNALRHTPARGTVNVRCSDEGAWVDISIADNGAGIAPEHMSHLFDRFYRADSARDRDQGGSGIGLSIAKAFVEAHGGHISAASPGLGSGATFTVRLRAS